MRRRGALLPAALLLAAAAAAAAKPPPLPAPDPARGALGIAVRYEVPLFHNTEPAFRVFFVRVREEADRLAGESLVPSTLAKEGQVFLLNARPGRYVAVAASFPHPNGRGAPFNGLFAEGMIPLTETEVRPGEMAFAGAYRVDTSRKAAQLDAAQLHYFRLVSPESAASGRLGHGLTGEATYLASLQEADRGEEAARKFWSQAAETFAREPAWLALVQGKPASP